MELTGQLCGVSRDFITKKPCISLMVNEDISGIDAFNGKDLKIKLVKATNPRSLDANAYFHVLCDHLRQKLGVSMAFMKNELITSYGQIEYMSEGVPATFKSNIPFEQMRELETPHLKFVRMSEDGNYMYVLYRGSHTYDTAEMHRLLEGTIEECKLQGIETKSPEEVKRLESLWKGE